MGEQKCKERLKNIYILVEVIKNNYMSIMGVMETREYDFRS